MDKDQVYNLLMEEIGHSGLPYSFHGLIEAMRTVKPEASIGEIFEVAQMLRLRDVSITPNAVIEFVQTIIGKTKCQRICVPAATGVEIDAFKETVPTIVYNTMNQALRDLIQEKVGVEYTSEADLYNSEYDLIYSDLPFGTNPKECIQQKIVDKCVDKIAPEGVGIFTFASNITILSSAKKWFADLAAKGVYITAIIDLPEGLYAPMTAVGSKIIVFSKKSTDKVFLAKLKKNEDAPVIAGYYLSKAGSPKVETLGKWFERNAYPDFVSYENDLRRQKMAAKLAKAYNAEMVTISEISTSILAPERTEAPFIDAENAVYIPKLGKSDVVTSLNELQIKPQNYFQILVNQERILPEFLKFFFNTDDGVTLRVRASVGAYIPVLNIQRIKEIAVPIPSIKTQAAILDVYTELNKLELEASRLKDRLESIPAAYSNIAKNIRDINNKGDKFEQWLESLPYPLATILKRYSTSDTNQQKQEMLFYFFEAYSIFVAAILTAVYQHPQFRNTEIEDIGIAYFEKASFGSWVKMDRALAKMIRIRMDDPNAIDSVLDCFHTDDQSLVKLISLGEIYSILQRTCDYRNLWKGHSGITSEAIYADHVRVLEEELLKLQERLKDLYEKIRLIRPVSLQHRHGEFINKVEILTGSNAIFKKDEIVGDALDEDKLYIQVNDTKDTYEVPPFFILKNSPADVKNACYFYNRLDGSNSRYVSYHFEGKPENIEEGEIAFDIIKAILSKTEN